MLSKKLSNVPYSFNNIPDTYENLQLEHSINSFDQSQQMHSLKYLLTDEKKPGNFREIPELDEEVYDSFNRSNEEVNQTPQFEDQKLSNLQESKLASQEKNFEKIDIFANFRKKQEQTEVQQNLCSLKEFPIESLRRQNDSKTALKLISFSNMEESLKIIKEEASLNLIEDNIDIETVRSIEDSQ